MCFFGRLLVGCHGLRIEMLYFINVNGNATAVTATSPLWVLLLLEMDRETGKGMYEAARLFIVLQINSFIQLI
jgi:hypothetical protein